MAKGSNNPRGRTSDASKPYDVSNSFVRRVTSRVSELMPQPSSWLSRWISPASTPNVNDYSGHSLSSTITSRPPATSRSELNLVVDNVDHHIPAKKARTTSRYNSPVSQNKFLRNDVYSPEDISPIAVRGEPVAGPSSAPHPELIASTPAVHIQPQNSTKVNGDDCSETSESTSGCSSLVPQAQLITRSLGGSRYGRTLPVTSNMDSMYGRRPSFSTTTFASPLRANMRERLGSSPFYSGRTMYGGSSQAYMSSIHPTQRRVGPTVKPMPTQEAMPLSSTAKRILDALEQFSTPVMDAKRMPVVGTKRKLDSGNQRYVELSIPTTPDLLRIKRLERLQQSTSAARQTATDSLPSPPSPAEYTIRKEEDTDKKKHTGKVKTKQKLTDEKVEVKLPAAVLPVDNLPKIDIAIPPPPQPLTTTSPTSTTTSNKFMFANPTVVPHSGNVVSPANVPTSVFQFSEPIGETSSKISVNMDIKPGLSSSVSYFSRTSSDNVTSDPKRHRRKNDSSVEPLFPSDSAKSVSHRSNDSALKSSPSTTSVTVQPDLRTSECKHCHTKIDSSDGSCLSCRKKQQNTNEKLASVTNQWECSLCKNKNSTSCEACVLCQTKKEVKSLDVTKNNVKATGTAGFGDLFKKPIGTWECSTCMIQNKNEATKCVACESAKPIKKDPSNNSIAVTSSLKDQFKKPSGSWDCQVCLITNKPTVTSCAACETPKAGAKSSGIPKTDTLVINKQTGNGFGDLFKKAPGSWTCNECMITNDGAKVKCVACETVKPGVTLPTTSDASIPKFSFGIPTTNVSSSSDVGTTFSFGIGKGDLSTSAKNTSFIMPKTSSSTDNSQAQASIPSQTFTFGIPKTTKTESDSTSGVTSSTASKPLFQFDSSSGQPSLPDSKLSLVNTVKNKQGVPDVILDGTVRNTISGTVKEVVSVESGKPQFHVKPNSGATIIPTSSINTDLKSVIPIDVKNEKSAPDPEKSTTSPPLFTFSKNGSDKLNDTNASSNPPQPILVFGSNHGSNVATSTTSTLSSSPSSNLYKFGDTKTVSSSGDVSSINTQPTFTAANTNSIFSFGSSNDKKEITFGTKTTKETTTASTVNVSATVDKPTFGSFDTTSNSSPAFGNTSTFGTSTFGNKEQPLNPFIPQTSSNAFAMTETTNASSSSTFSGFGQTNAFQTAVQENKPLAGFTFGSTPSKEPPATGGFVFSPVAPKKRTGSGFGFAAAQTNPTVPTFFNNTSSTPPTTFNFEQKPFGSGISPFSQTSDASPAFGAPTPQQPTSTFGEQANSNTLFAFGSQPAQQPSPANPIFEFGSNQQQTQPPAAPAQSTTFVFGANSTAAPAMPAFDPNIRPSFNFSQGSTPVFSAIPTINPTATAQPAVRKIRKAVRRTNVSSVRQT